MIKTVPTLGRIAVMALFALSSFAACLYLWMAFGGSSPLKPQGYQFRTSFPEATQLANQSDVRISGVSVGKVIKLEPDGNRTRATIELRQRLRADPEGHPGDPARQVAAGGDLRRAVARQPQGDPAGRRRHAGPRSRRVRPSSWTRSSRRSTPRRARRSRPGRSPRPQRSADAGLTSTPSSATSPGSPTSSASCSRPWTRRRRRPGRRSRRRARSSMRSASARGSSAGWSPTPSACSR